MFVIILKCKDNNYNYQTKHSFNVEINKGLDCEIFN